MSRPVFDAMQYRGQMNPYMLQMMGMNGGDDTASPEEAVGADASAIKLNVTVSASWDIAK